MSIKRSKQPTFRRRDRDDPVSAPLFGAKPAPAEPEKSWAEHMEGKPEEAFLPYALTARFEKGALMRHATFGRGIVLAVSGPRMEVLFEGGVKKLGCAS